MQLVVNGVIILVEGRLEVLIDVADDGERLPEGATICIRGGSLIMESSETSDGLTISVDSPIVVRGLVDGHDTHGLRIKNKEWWFSFMY